MAATGSGEAIDRATLRSSRVTFDPAVGVLGRPLSSYVEQSTAAASRSSVQLGVRATYATHVFHAAGRSINSVIS